MKRLLIIFGVIAVIFFGAAWGIGAYLAVDDLKDCAQTPDSTGACAAADAIVAVSGGDTTARASEAITLYKRGWAKYIIFSGAAADKSGPSNAAVMKRQALLAGVPENAIFIEAMSETTEENAANTTQILMSHKISSVILVTSAYHERRATIEFKKSAPSVVVRSHPVASDKQWRGSSWWLMPTGWILAVQELGKIIIILRGE